MSNHIKKYRNGFLYGKNIITDAKDRTGIELSFLNLNRDITGIWTESDGWNETCVLLLNGTGQINFDTDNENGFIKVSRKSLFDENPCCFIIPRDTDYRIIPEGDMDVMLIKTRNLNRFKPVFYEPGQIRAELRGDGILDNTAKRLVRTVFDHSDMPHSWLVVGEVVTQPGRFSSYPDHRHPQPEIYFYRFQHKQGYGFCKLGQDEALVVGHNDAVKILDDKEHPQVAAPGYVMWYLWVIRHLPDNPYITPEDVADHKWTLDPKAKIWQPKDW